MTYRQIENTQQSAYRRHLTLNSILLPAKTSRCSVQCAKTGFLNFAFYALHVNKYRVQHPIRQLTTWHCPHWLLRAVLRRRCCNNRSIPAGRRAHSSKPAAAACGGQWRDKRTDRRTDGRQLHRRCMLRILWRQCQLTTELSIKSKKSSIYSFPRINRLCLVYIAYTVHANSIPQSERKSTQTFWVILAGNV